ncbi:MAG: ABC transporter ATP-binding protein [Elusimicrobia bacterium]|nr:ABC transporter ATP-binding protein [Elusimicrobiota bacterium]
MTSPATALRLEGVGKCYMVSTLAARETFPQTLNRLLTGNSSRRALWALRGLSFELARGEVLGVIGANGAGKSTLLMLLAQIIAPTEGRVEVHGKSSIFFQLASGLRPQLTVLDNFSVCAALLGIERAKFRELLPAMVEFSGLGDYLHARYGELSSGLAARVPFAAAVHAKLDIVMADEMIAVGDEAFQQKCFKTFEEFRRSGKTMVLASHGMDLVAKLCTKSLYLRGGAAAYFGDPIEAIRRYGADSSAPGSALARAEPLL